MAAAYHIRFPLVPAKDSYQPLQKVLLLCCDNKNTDAVIRFPLCAYISSKTSTGNERSKVLNSLAPQHPAARALANGLLFNISWFAIVATHSNTLAPIIAGAHLLVHFMFFGTGRNEVLLILGITLVGLLLDNLMFAAGIFIVAGVPAPSPWWLSCLWPVLGTTLMHAFSTLQQRLILASIVGAAGGTASYMGGTRLSDIDFGDPIFGPMTIALIWAIAFPALLAAATWVSLRGVQANAN